MSISLFLSEIFAISVKLPEIAPNFGRFLHSQILREAVPPRYHVCLAARRLEKFGEVDPPGPKVIGAHTPNVGQIFDLSFYFLFSFIC